MATPLSDDDWIRACFEAMPAELRTLTRRVAQQFFALTQRKAQRLFHPVATTTRGRLQVCSIPGFDGRAPFEAGAVHPVIVRHANGVQADDAAWDNRGASLRVLAPSAEPGPFADLDAALLDLPMTTGECFTSRSASEFVAWMASPRGVREQLAQAAPHLSEAAWTLFRAPSSYLEVHYYTKLAQRYVDDAGREHYARYRLVPLDAEGRPIADGAFLEREGLLPPDQTSRRKDDTRPPDFLHDELRGRIEGGPLRLRLQIQLRPATADARERDAILDGTRPWSATEHPWLDRAELELDGLVDDASVEGLRFNPGRAPAELGLLHGVSPTDSASLNHLRAMVYALAARARDGHELPAWLSEAPSAPGRARVAVVGAGVSGLAVARELEAAGVTVTVFERAELVGGKSRSVEIGGRVFDLGAHLCSPAYRETGALVDALGLDREPVSRVVHLDLDTGEALTPDVTQLREVFLRYQSLKRADFPRVSAPGFGEHLDQLAMPAAEWLEARGLAELSPLIAVGLTASGYGFLDDPELSAYHALKYAEMATFCMPSADPEYWTPRGGFGQLSAGIAAELGDLRLGADIESIARSSEPGGVAVQLQSGETEHFDHVVMAAPWHVVPELLELDEDAETLFEAFDECDYFTAIFEAEGLPREGFFLLPACADRRTPLAAFHHRYADSPVYLAWAYAPLAASDGDLWALLDEELGRLGGRLGIRHGLHRWRYFPRAGVTELREGAYARLDALQGQSRTWFVGSMLDFELVECNLRAAKAVAQGLLAELGVEDRRPALAAGPSLFERLSALEPAARARAFSDYLQDAIARELELPPERIGWDIHVLELGLDSVRTVQVFEVLVRDSQLTLAPMLFFEHTTIRALGEHLAGEFHRQHQRRPQPRAAGEEPRRRSAPRPGTALTRALDEAGDEAGRVNVLVDYLQRLIGAELERPPAQLDPRVPFASLGLDSVRSVALLDELGRDSDLVLAPTVLFEHAHIDGLARHLAREHLDQHGERKSAARPDDHRGLEARMGRMEQVLTQIQGQLEALTRGQGGGRAAPSTPRALVAGPSPWLRVHDSSPPAPRRLLCFHYAGGDPINFDPWVAELPPDLGVYAVRLPGRAGHPGPAPASFEALVDALDEALAPVLDRPFALFGHSFGALVAYLFAQRCAAQRRPPTALFASSFWAPHRWRPGPGRALLEASMSPAQRLDHALLDTWEVETIAGLDLPVVVFGGRDDRVVPRAALDDWLPLGDAVSIHLMPGGHFHAFASPALARIVGALTPPLDPVPSPAPGPDAVSPATIAPELEAALGRIDAGLDGPASTLGTWNLYDLSWLARVRGPTGAPRYPGVLDRLVAVLVNPRELRVAPPRSPHSRVIAAASCLETLAQWHGVDGRDFQTTIDALGERLSAALDADDPFDRGVGRPYGMHFQYTGILGQAALASAVLRRLLTAHGACLDPQLRAKVEAASTGPALAPSPSAFAGAGDFRLLHAEFADDATLRSSEVAAYVARVHPELPGQSAALAARHVEVSSCESTEELLAPIVADPIGTTRPSGRLQETLFALYFLAKAGVELTRHCPQAMDALRDAMRPHGVGIYERSLVVDTDSTAIALYVSASQGIDHPIRHPARLLDSLWNPDTRCYRSTVGELTNLNITLFALRAYLSLPGLDEDHARQVWRRTLAQLDERQWISPDHLSPLYGWENLMSVLFEHEARFPDIPTRHHHLALERVLSLQTPCGGFRSAHYEGLAEPDLEESALGLLALDAARRGRLDPDQRGRVEAAIARARPFVDAGFRRYLATGEGLREAWNGKLLFASAQLTEAVCLAALLRSPPAGATSSAPAPKREAEDWSAQWRPSITVEPAHRSVADGGSDSRPRTWLLTGATGFLGRYLLSDLLRDPEARVHCLVREPTGDLRRARARLARALAAHQLRPEGFESRVEIHVGDLESPSLGLGDALLERLAEEVDAILHNGARVDLIARYEQLRRANVDSTRRLLALAAAGRPKTLDLVSTLGVFGDRLGGLVFEDELGAPARLPNGYTQSKAVAERLALAEGARGLAVRVLRPGLITAASSTGAGSSGDMFMRFVAGLVAVGAAPAELGEDRLRGTPVDRLSPEIVALASAGAPSSVDWIGDGSPRYHLLEPSRLTVGDLYTELRSLGARLELLPFERWVEAFSARAAPSNPFVPLFDAFVVGQRRRQTAPPGSLGRPRYDTSQARRALARRGRGPVPSLDRAALRAGLEASLRQLG